jgi:pyrimidine deaminase RibD-like protein
LLADTASCAKTRGCAYVDSGCVIFAGCSAYKGATDAECQAISKFCNSDGVAFCVAPGTCSSYKTEETCTGKASSAGSGTCVWDSGCRD